MNDQADDSPVGSERDPRITRAIKFMRRVSENDSVNRVNAQFWRKFRYGEQWPAEIQNSRQLEQRPCIVVNKTDTFCKQVENQQRQQRPRIKVDPTNGAATKKNADVIKGMIRHIESAKGGADMAYDTGFSHAITEGTGYWRIMSDYVKQDSFEQELYLASIRDSLSVYYDDHALMPDGSDAEECLIVEDMGKGAFKSENPNADDGASFIPADMGGFSNNDWCSKDTIRVAEYFYVERQQMKLHKLSDGTVVWDDDMPPDEAITDAGLKVVAVREGIKKQIKWCKITAIEVLDERELPGRFIPVIPCYGELTVIDGKVRRHGLVKNAVGPQQMSNFWKTAMTESVALAPKAKWLLAEGQDEGHENEWATANTSARATLRYKPTDVSGQRTEMPQRMQPEPPPEGAMAMAQSVDGDLSAVLGIVDPAMRIGGNVSGKALQAERVQSDVSTFNYFDSMVRAIAFTGRQLLELMPYYYNEPGRVVRIVGDDGTSTTQQINQPHPDDPQKIINDVTVGEYDVVMDAGPGYNTRRQEARDAMTPLFEKNEKLMDVAGDVYFRTMDYSGADVIADRLAAANPLSQIDEQSDIPPAAQMRIKTLEKQVQDMGQQLQSAAAILKDRSDVEAAKQAGETHRTLLKESAQTERNTDDNQAWMHDVAVKSHTSLGVAEIKVVGDILTQDKDHKHDAEQFEKTAEHEDKQLAAQTAKAPA